MQENVVYFPKNNDLVQDIFIPPNPGDIERYYKYKDEKYEVGGSYRSHLLEATKCVGVRKNLVYPVPLPEDIKATKQLVAAGRILDIELVDHIIIGNQRFVSLKEHPRWK